MCALWVLTPIALASQVRPWGLYDKSLVSGPQGTGYRPRKGAPRPAHNAPSRSARGATRVSPTRPRSRSHQGLVVHPTMALTTASSQNSIVCQSCISVQQGGQKIVADLTADQFSQIMHAPTVPAGEIAPELAPRIAEFGLEANCRELADEGYTVVRDAAPLDFFLSRT